MVSPTTLFAVTVVACLSTSVNGHGYMTIPEAVPLANPDRAAVQADWNSISNDDDLIALYVEKAKEDGYDKDIRKLLNSDTKLYGADCGYSDPNATPKMPPSDGTATFSRGIAHHGPCEIWVGDKMALHDDDCAKTFSVPDYMSIKSVFKPVDYSSCSSSGCMFRFYWLAFQGSTSGKYVWQIYKDCIPLTGPGAGKTSTAGTNSVASNTTQSSDTEAPSSNSLSTQAPEVQTPSSTNAPSAPTTENTGNAPEVQATQAPTPAPQTWNVATQAPSMNAQLQVTNAPVWTNAPAAETPGTVAPFTQDQATPAPALITATNTPNSYSFNNRANTPNTPVPDQAQNPSFSF
ncbi:hypothetical protein V7S43_002451 [Phytophthora oleae]|uniref:Uncharacterized protein n=1 Tax=Phytophthora oleae TaxID=2107226 RepID=A0ABD3G3K4_9STRA